MPAKRRVRPQRKISARANSAISALAELSPGKPNRPPSRQRLLPVSRPPRLRSRRTGPNSGPSRLALSRMRLSRMSLSPVGVPKARLWLPAQPVPSHARQRLPSQAPRRRLRRRLSRRRSHPRPSRVFRRCRGSRHCCYWGQGRSSFSAGAASTAVMRLAAPATMLALSRNRRPVVRRRKGRGCRRRLRVRPPTSRWCGEPGRMRPQGRRRRQSRPAP